ncbi:putative type VI secretion system effector [Burkholderia cepacia]|uniref:putative type VI secretion system effector n=1 Tax=Burkholderia cepacia TaxID=292 RepID=UPI0009BDD837|nr:putative type VI secretion system effector [Burkholderia cepacia]
MDSKQATTPVLLRGTITGLTKRRAAYEAVFTEADKQAMERTAVVAALAGLNDIALNLSTSTQFTDTVGDLVTFRLNGEEVRAWIWLSVFENGDEVEVVAERAGTGWIGYAIRRCSDGVLSVHPHCERGSRALFKSFLKLSVLFWSGCALAMTLLVTAMVMRDSSFDRWKLMFEVYLTGWLTIEVVAVFIAYRVWARFKRQLPMANRIFATFGWKDPPNVNLPKTSKKLRQSEDAWQMGKLIFRYVES